MANKKVAIVGGGIAGTVLAWTALQRNWDVTLFNQEKKNTPSQVAGGLLNPLSISRKKLIFKGEEFIKNAISFYSTLPHHSTFLFNHEMKLFYYGLREFNDWQTSDAAEKGFIRSMGDDIYIKHSAWIDTIKLLEKGTFDPALIYVSQRIDDIESLEKQFDTVFLATGFLPSEFAKILRKDVFRPVLGDIFIIKCSKKYEFSHLEGAFIIPLGSNKYCTGSTYVNDFNSVEPSPSRAKSFLDKLANQNIEIEALLEHRVAVRPATFDRFPLVGNIKSNIYSFTGMGSRALLHAPLLAQQLLEVVEARNEELLMPVARISRAISKAESFL